MTKKNWPLVIFVLVSLRESTFADSFSSPIKGGHCAPLVESWMAKSGSTAHWSRKVDPEPDAKSYRASRKNFGTWIEVHLLPGGIIEGQRISSEGVEFVSWALDCKETIKQSKINMTSTKNEPIFSDQDLSDLIHKNKKGLLYIWSPGMVYSMDFYPQVKKVASRLDLPLTILMDPYFDEKAAEKKAKEFGMPFFNTRVEAVELLMRDIGTHYPETLVYGNGKLAEKRLVGVMTPDIFEKEIELSLKGISK